jgi:hypothetical protein
VVKLTGDGALVEFESAVNAVECAVAIQTGMAEREAGMPEERCIRNRIGINIGDVVGSLRRARQAEVAPRLASCVAGRPSLVYRCQLTIRQQSRMSLPDLRSPPMSDRVAAVTQASSPITFAWSWRGAPIPVG